MSKEFKLFDGEENSFKIKLLRTMDLLVSNKSSSRMECIFLLSISYLQIISALFSDELGLFTKSAGSPDSYLATFKSVIRIKDLFQDNYSTYEMLMYLILAFLILLTFGFLFTVLNSKSHSFYSLKEKIINLSLKLFNYILFIPILDLSLALICSGNVNPNFSDQTCSLSSNLALTLTCIITFFYSIFISIILSLFFNDSLLLSNSFYSRISCNYELYHTINIIISSILLTLQNYLGALIFFIYNMIQSTIQLKFVFDKYLFYDRTTNFLVMMFHMIYTLTSALAIIFSFLSVQQKSFLFVTCYIITIFMFANLKRRLEERIILKTPFHKIRNDYHIMFYFKCLIDKINNLDNNTEDKAHFIGIIQSHINECPLVECQSKSNSHLYLPVTNEWSTRSTPETSDKVYLLNFVTFVFNYYVLNDMTSPDLLFNISAYYLIIMGNLCQSMIYHKKIKYSELSFQEKFSYQRNEILISKGLVEKLKPSTEACYRFEELDTRMYFKYEHLSEKILEEINNDVNFNIEFWNIFKRSKQEYKILDFNKVFYLTDRIRKCKIKVENIWHDLINTFYGFNDIFDLYQNYIEEVNDDEITFRRLETLKNKLLSYYELLGAKNNLQNLLFSKDVGIIILNGGKGKEGMIEKVNENIHKIFNLSNEDLKGCFINILIPKVFERNHRSYIERYITVGEKRIADKRIKTYGKDKSNNIVVISTCVKLFPILEGDVYFCGIITNEGIDDVILLDQNFIIQGMSAKLMKLFKLNQNLFQDCEVPFYLICSTFITHYKNFMNRESLENKNSEEIREEDYEISENAGMEYEIVVPSFLCKYIGRFTDGESKAANYSARSENADGLEPEMFNLAKDESFYEDDVSEAEHLALNEAEITVSFNSYTTKTSEEKQFHSKLDYFKSIFNKKDFDTLQSEIEKLNTDQSEAFKFIYTFNKLSFGENGRAYVVRLINRSEENSIGGKSEESLNINNFQSGLNLEGKGFDRHGNITALFNFKEVTKEEIESNDLVLNEFSKILREQEEYSSLIAKYREVSLASSRILGIKKVTETNFEDSSFQSSASSFHDNLSKKTRIEEIKHEMLKHSKNFNSIKLIKWIFFVIMLLTVTFSILFNLMINSFFSDILAVDRLNTLIYDNTINLVNLVSSLMSMKSIFEILMARGNSTFIRDNLEDYFNFYRSFSLSTNDIVKLRESYIEDNFTKYSPASSELYLWDDVYSGFNVPGYPSNRIGYSIAMELSLSSSNSLLLSEFFTVNFTRTNLTLNEDAILHFQYYLYYSTQYSYDFLVPHQLSLVEKMNDIFINFNDENIKGSLNVIFVYLSSVSVLILIYLFNIYLTNKNMEMTLMKVSKIPLNLIDETIIRIKNFNENVLSKYKQKENFKMIKESEKEEKKNQIKIPENFSFEMNESIKKLSILNYSYFQVILFIFIFVSIIIPVYFITSNAASNANLQFLTKKFIFGDYLRTGTSILSTKCTISNCKVTGDIIFNNTLTPEEWQTVIAQINFFPETNSFYNTQYIQNICNSLYGLNITKMYNLSRLQYCNNDTIVKSIQSYEGLLIYISEGLDMIKRDFDLQSQMSSSLNSTLDRYNYFQTGYYKSLDYIFYNYITPMPSVLQDVFSSSLGSYTTRIQQSIMNLLILFCIFMIVFSGYIILIYTKSLVQSLLISRYILKIIPTGVINKTPELGEWLENKY